MAKRLSRFIIMFRDTKCKIMQQIAITAYSEKEALDLWQRWLEAKGKFEWVQIGEVTKQRKTKKNLKFCPFVAKLRALMGKKLKSVIKTEWKTDVLKARTKKKRRK